MKEAEIVVCFCIISVIISVPQLKAFTFPNALFSTLDLLIADGVIFNLESA